MSRYFDEAVLRARPEELDEVRSVRLKLCQSPGLQGKHTPHDRRRPGVLEVNLDRDGSAGRVGGAKAVSNEDLWTLTDMELSRYSGR